MNYCTKKDANTLKKSYAEMAKGIDTAKQLHTDAAKFLEALCNRDIPKVKTMLLNYNRGASTGSIKVAVLMDATGSMSGLITQGKNTVQEMFKRISYILTQNNMDPKCFQLQFVAYRNYNAPESELLRASGWCDDPIELNKFLFNIQASYGIGTNEAVEIALSYMNQDPNVSEIIIIGDACANTKDEVKTKRQGEQGGEQYWAKTKFNTPVYFEEEIALLKHKNIKVNAFYLADYAKNDFNKMASLTGGIFEYLDINSPKGAELLTGLVSKRVLNATGGDKLVKAYEQKFHI